MPQVGLGAGTGVVLARPTSRGKTNARGMFTRESEVTVVQSRTALYVG